MTFTFDLLVYQASILGHAIPCVVDTGSALNLMSVKLARKLNIIDQLFNSTLYFRTADASVSEANGEPRDVPVSFAGTTFLITFAVIEECCHPLLLGTSFMSEALASIHFVAGGEEMHLTNNGRAVTVPVSCMQPSPVQAPKSKANPVAEEEVKREEARRGIRHNVATVTLPHFSTVMGTDISTGAVTRPVVGALVP